MMAKRSNRMAWGLVAVLAVTVLSGIRILGRPYWVAKYRGEKASLRGALLVWAPLASADLEDANLEAADLRSADLRNADLAYANLANADLRAADLRGACLFADYLDVTHDRPPPIPSDYGSTVLTGTRYDHSTCWPTGFDPRQHGAVLVK
jgi:hypothetical protein